MSAAVIQHIARYRRNDRIHHGRREAEGFARLDAPPWAGGHDSGAFDRDDEITLLAPVVPGKIVCVGLNYKAHIAESISAGTRGEAPREPLLFLKPPSAVIATGEAIRYPRSVTRLDPEAEMAVVIGRRARHVRVEEALDHVAGVTAFNDVSARNHQREDGQWTRAKGFDTFAPLGPWVTVGLDPGTLALTCRVNGVTRQHGHTSDLLFPVPVLIGFISGIMTLEPGDVIATGTPSGIAPVAIGDRIEVEVEGVGVLANYVEGPGT